MIISASRRTDIPAFYTPWLLNRFREGRVLVRNPFNRRQVAEISLSPSVVDCVVLWTKNPAPLLPSIPQIEAMGYPLVMQYTISGCDQVLESGLPELSARLASFQQVSRLLGPERVLWRFDPIVLTGFHDREQYLTRFAFIAEALHGLTRQCTISFVSLYAKCRRNLSGVDLVEMADADKKMFANKLASIAGRYGIRLKACCDSFLVDECGVERASCIDARQLGAILGENFSVKKDPGQRPGCGCTLSVDIGAYDSCPHGCRYCYANSSLQAVRRNSLAHDSASPLLIGRLQGDETVRRREMVSLRQPQANLLATPVNPAKPR